MPFENKVVLITGGSRGIGKSIAISLARAGAKIAIVGKTITPHPKLEGTIYSAAKDIEAVSKYPVLAIPGDIRFEDQIENIVHSTVEKFGGIDILINNASAISLTNTPETEPKKWDLMHDINVRGTYFMSRSCIPYLKNAENPHILSLSPPLNMDPQWFGKHLAYTMSKYGMSMITKGLAAELKSDRIAVNSLWPRTTIATAAVQNLLGGDFIIQRSRTAAIVADAAFHILQQPSFECSGNFYIDEQVLKEQGVTDFSKYAVNPDQKLMTDLFID